MEKWGRLWGLAGRCLLAAGSWSWGVCRVCLMALILTFHLQGGALLLGLIVLSVAGILYKLQDSLLFFPDQPASSRLYVPAPTGVAHESVFIRAKDGVRLNLLLLRHPGDGPRPGSAPTVLYFHGNAGNVGHRVPNALLMLASLKANVALLDYRGYGRSEGEPSEAGLGLDAQAALDYVTARPDLGPGRVVLFGRSLGGAVAARLAAENPHRVAALVLENTFLSIPHVAAALCAFLPVRLLPLWCYRNRFPSHRHVARCRVPSLFVSGLADQLIPPVMMKRLYELSPARAKRMAVFPDGTHNHTWQCPGYFPALQHFVAGHARQEAAPGGAGVTVI